MRRWLLVVSVALLGLAPTLFARPASAGPQVELTVLGGGMFGGDFQTEEVDGQFGNTWNVSGMLGLRPSEDDHQVFFVSYQYQLSDLELDFETRPDLTVPLHIGRVHAGIEADGRLKKWIHPFLGLSLGATHYTPDFEDTKTTWFFSTALYGGVKVPLASWVGLRLQGGMVATVIGEDAGIVCLSNTGTCITAEQALGVIQAEAAGGLYFRF